MSDIKCRSLDVLRCGGCDPSDERGAGLRPSSTECRPHHASPAWLHGVPSGLPALGMAAGPLVSFVRARPVPDASAGCARPAGCADRAGCQPRGQTIDRLGPRARVPSARLPMAAEELPTPRRERRAGHLVPSLRMAQRLTIRYGLAIAALMAALTSNASAAELGGPSDPKPVIDGTVVAECGWPTVVSLHADIGNGTERCTGAYVGDRVVLTASHCVSPGFSLPTVSGCELATDCPSVNEYDNVIDLDCATDDFYCEDPDQTYSNKTKYAFFGEEYPGVLDEGHVRKAVPIAYCRRLTDDPGDEVSTVNDFAYCVLTEIPNIQPVHPMMHCEADQYLADNTPIVAVGFGRSVSGDGSSYGIKRTASSSLSEPADSDTDIMFQFSTWMPGEPSHGDSGGPLFVQLPDSSWRVVAVASNSLPSYATVWNHMAWVATDPNVNIEAVLPCHTTAGEWDPGALCTAFVTDPGSPEGKWARSPRACDHQDVTGNVASCTALVASPELELAVPERTEPDAGRQQSSLRGCSGTLGIASNKPYLVSLLSALLLGRCRRKERCPHAQ